MPPEMSELIKVRIDGAAPVPLVELVELWRSQNPVESVAETNHKTNYWLEESEFSNDEIRKMLSDSIQPGSASGPIEPSLWIRDIWSDYFVYESGGATYKRTYSISKNGTVKLGEPEKVVMKTTYEQESAVGEIDASLAESEEGKVLMIGEGADNNYAGPVVMEVALIKPGFGNSKDNHYYPRKTLEDAAPLFVGKKMYLTNHVQGEHNTRNEVSEILACPVGFTEEGAPIARVGVFDPVFAANVRNRAALGTLGHLHCSINGTGSVKKNAIEEGGRKGHVVEAITAVDTFDWVPQAGAGGHALKLIEMEDGKMDKTGDEVKDVKEEEKNVEAVTESIQEKEAPVALDSSIVLPILMGAGLPDKTVGRLAERKWFSSEEVNASIKEMQELMADVQEAGRPRNLGQSTEDVPKEERTPQQLHEAQLAIVRKYGLAN